MKVGKFSENVIGPWWWWASFTFAAAGLLSARYIYISNLSAWLRKPDAVATLVAITVALVCVGAFVLVSARRATEIGSSPKALLTNLLILPIPFWILALGSLPAKTEGNPFPIAGLLRRLKFVGGIVLTSGAVILTAYYYFGNRAITVNSGQNMKKDNSGKELLAVPSFSECYDKGIAYYKEIGSYPRLRSTDEYVPDVVDERCQRSRLAFGR